ncbi:MAG: glycosyltransferase family 2 protein [Bacteroidaceae bacterium]|nr:glycosyltransferase family 2 protein [Bacteroidaceae bacterium]
MEISVIIPTYKPVYEYMDKCLGSLFAQTYNHSDFDIIIILNGCNEPYLSMINEIRGKYDDSISVRVLQTDTPGPSNARNLGMEVSDASFFCFVDYDDWVSPEYIRRLHAVATDDTVAQSNVVAINDSDGSEKPDYIGYYHNKLYGQALTPIKAVHFLSNVATKLISRDIIGSRRFQDINIGEDALFITSASDRISRVVPAERDAVYYRRIHDSSLVHSKYSIKEWFRNRCRLTALYTKTLMGNLRGYSVLLFMHRIAAVWKGFFKELFRRK